MASPATIGSARPHKSKQPLAEEELRKMHAYWRAASYLSVVPLTRVSGEIPNFP